MPTATPAPSAPGCTDSSPGARAPWLYAATAQSSSSILLYFTEAQDPVDRYALEFGTSANNYQFGADNIGGKGSYQYLVQSLSPGITYYFRVRGGNGCATGPWSNEISVQTKGWFSFSSLDIIKIVIPTSTPTPVIRRIATPTIKPTTIPTFRKSPTPSLRPTATPTKRPTLTPTVTIRPRPSTTPTPTRRLKATLLISPIIKLTSSPTLKSSQTPTLTQAPTIEPTPSPKEELASIPIVEISPTPQMSEEEGISSPTPKNTVKLKVFDDRGEPLVGVKVTLFSEPKVSFTDKEGVAEFTNVEAGQHKVEISYQFYRGQQNLFLPEGAEIINLTVQVKMTFNYWLLAICGILIISFSVISLKYLELKRRISLRG